MHSQEPQLLRVLWVRLPTTCPYHPPSPANSPPTHPTASVFHKSQFPSSSEGKEWTGRPRRSGQASLTFPQRVQAVEHELVDGAADGAVVQRGRAAPSGQHGRKLSRKEPHRPQWAPVRARGGAARGVSRKVKIRSLISTSPLPSPQQESYSASLLSLPSTLPRLVNSTYPVIPQALGREQTMYIKDITFLRVCPSLQVPPLRNSLTHTPHRQPRRARAEADSPQRTSWCLSLHPPRDRQGYDTHPRKN